jgi:phosphoribosylglycinamide formyltransferase-1
MSGARRIGEQPEKSGPNIPTLDPSPQGGGCRLPVQLLGSGNLPSREAFEDVMTRILESWEVDIVCLAGFMRILTPEFTLHWAGRMINIHPSLLPLYKGLDTHARALADGATVHGCTVHFVTPGLDEGAPILSAEVPVLPGDTPDTLAARILVEEHRIYPEALRMLAAGEIAAS